MQGSHSVALVRDCEAVQIPVGNTVVLPGGTEVEIMQRLGGSYTISAMGSLFRVAATEADALGIEAGLPSGATPSAQPAAALGLPNEEMVWDTLRTCYDPEIPVNIVDLGLVYDMRIEPLPGGQCRIQVQMSLTAPGCGMGATIAGDAQQKLLGLPGVEQADVQIVWDPPWHHSRISAAGRATLGLDS